MGSTRGCTVRAAMPSGIIQIYRSDLTSVLQKRLAALDAAVEYEKNREWIEAEERRRLQEQERARQSVIAELVSKRALSDLMIKMKVEEQKSIRIVWKRGKKTAMTQAKTLSPESDTAVFDEKF